MGVTIITLLILATLIPYIQPSTTTSLINECIRLDPQHKLIEYEISDRCTSTVEIFKAGRKSAAEILP